jgi:hypothetical protein
LRRPERDDHVLYSSHTVGRAKLPYRMNRVRTFSRAHRDAGANKPHNLGHPEFEGFATIQTIKNPNARDQAT